jgi:hypothetical protein
MTDIKIGPNIVQQRTARMLKAEDILAYLLDTDDALDTLIKCKPSDVDLISYDQSLYEALGSFKDYDEFNFRKLVKLIESADIVSFKGSLHQPRPVLTEERVEELRQKALAKTKGPQKKEGVGGN